MTDKALLVNLDISQWTAHKHDKTISKKIEQEHNAHQAGRYNKVLIKKESLKELHNIASAAREFLNERTLPWGDNGDRVLSSAIYFDFITEFKVFKDKYDAATASFIAKYPQLKDEARINLNGMYQESDYPSVEALWRKFGMEIKFMAIPNSSDFRIQLDQDEVDTLRNKIEREINSRILQATKSMYTRIKEALGHMVERLSDKEAVFRDTLVTNIVELVEILPRLNFTNDPEITSIVESMKNLLVRPDKLRRNSILRTQKAQEAQSILDKVSGFLGS
jgi:hypothetical protein